MRLILQFVTCIKCWKFLCYWSNPVSFASNRLKKHFYIQILFLPSFKYCRLFPHLDSENNCFLYHQPEIINNTTYMEGFLSLSDLRWKNIEKRHTVLLARGIINKYFWKFRENFLSNSKKQLCRWRFSEIENLLQTFYRDNHKNMVFYSH